MYLSLLLLVWIIPAAFIHLNCHTTYFGYHCINSTFYFFPAPSNISLNFITNMTLWLTLRVLLLFEHRIGHYDQYTNLSFSLFANQQFRKCFISYFLHVCSEADKCGCRLPIMMIKGHSGKYFSNSLFIIKK